MYENLLQMHARASYLYAGQCLVIWSAFHSKTSEFTKKMFSFCIWLTGKLSSLLVLATPKKEGMVNGIHHYKLQEGFMRSETCFI